MADCDEISLMLGPFGDGEIEPHEMQEVARHLAACAECEELLNDYSLVGRELRALAISPPLEGFAEAVEARIRKLRLPRRVRLARRLGTASQRMGAAVAFGSFAAAAAVLTAVLVTPWARQYLARELPGSLLAGITRNAGEHAPQLAATAGFAAVAENSRAVISRLESGTSSVAVWSEPEEGTTVIWLPEQGQ